MVKFLAKGRPQDNPLIVPKIKNNKDLNYINDRIEFYQHQKNKVGFLATHNKSKLVKGANVILLVSEKSNLKKFGQNLFSVLR